MNKWSKWDIAENEQGVSFSVANNRARKRVLINSLGKWNETLPTMLCAKKVVASISEIDGKRALVFRPSFSEGGHVLNLNKANKQWAYNATKDINDELAEHSGEAYRLSIAEVQEGYLTVKEAIAFLTPENRIEIINEKCEKPKEEPMEVRVMSPTLQIAMAVADLQKAFDTKCQADIAFKKTVLDILERIETNQKRTQQAICALKEEWK